VRFPKSGSLLTRSLGPSSRTRRIDRGRGYVTLCPIRLVKERLTRLAQRKWPEEKLPVGLESIRNFNVRAKVVGPSVSNRLNYPVHVA
jgi:hypothetical protein